MRRFLAAGAISLAAAAAPTLQAAPFSAAFDTLRTELESRRDGDFGGTLDAARKKQQKAVLKGIASLDRPADDLGDDLKNAGRIGKLLMKAYPAEFGGVALRVGPAAVLDLGDVVSTLAYDLEALVQADFDDLSGGLAGLSLKGQAKVQAALDRAALGLGQDWAADQVLDHIKALGKSWKSIAKGRKTAAKDPGPDLTGGFVATVDGKAYKPTAVTVAFSEGAGGMNVGTGKAGNPTLTLTFAATGITGTGTFSIGEASYIVAKIPPDTFLGDTGTLTITALDTTAKTITFTFSFTAPGVGLTGGSVTVSGSYTGPYTPV
jgi:hypothetical protein